MSGNRARDERRRKARYNRDHTARRVAAIQRERAKRHAAGDFRAEERANYKSALKANAAEIVAQARAEVAAQGFSRNRRDLSEVPAPSSENSDEQPEQPTD
jgi:hypothetical protein